MVTSFRIGMKVGKIVTENGETEIQIGRIGRKIGMFLLMSIISQTIWKVVALI